MTDNDLGNRLPERCGVWRTAHDRRKLLSLRWHTEGPAVVVSSHYQIETTPISGLTLEYRIFPDGTIRVQETFVPGSGLPDIPEIGMLFLLDEGLDILSWYGRGHMIIIGTERREPKSVDTREESPISSFLI